MEGSAIPVVLAGGVLTTIKGSNMKNMWLSITALLALMFAFWAAEFLRQHQESL